MELHKIIHTKFCRIWRLVAFVRNVLFYDKQDKTDVLKWIIQSFMWIIQWTSQFLDCYLHNSRGDWYTTQYDEFFVHCPWNIVSCSINCLFTTVPILSVLSLWLPRFCFLCLQRWSDMSETKTVDCVLRTVDKCLMGRDIVFCGQEKSNIPQYDRCPSLHGDCTKKLFVSRTVTL
jgi:hypothetical protein